MPLLMIGAAGSLAIGGAGRHCPGADPCPAITRAHIDRVRTVVLLGERRVQRSRDQEAAGRSEAFAFRAARSGVATRIAVYLDASSHAQRVSVAIYSSARGAPAGLLVSGATRHPRAGRWTGISVRSKRLHKGTQYWLAVLGSGGAVGFRDRASTTCVSHESAQVRLSSFPRHWFSGPRWQTCALSAYVTGRPFGSGAPLSRPAPKPPTHPTAPPPRPPPPAPPPPPRTTNCFSAPSACGYPDQSNTGVPASVSLSPSGSITVSTPGTVVSGKDVNGQIEISADNVTVKDVRVTNSGDTSSAIHIDSGVSGTTIEDSTLRGQASTNAIQYAVTNGGTRSTGLRLQMYNCTECWSGNGTLRDSYAISNGTISGSHYEAVYIPGGSSDPTDLEHNTLLNPHDQTAGVFGDDHAYGPMQNVTVNNNLVASGGNGIDTGCNGDGNSNIVVTNNRLSYSYNSRMPQGGSNTSPAVTTWTNNYRDDTLKSVPIAAGC
jgi:hypothetical protein